MARIAGCLVVGVFASAAVWIGCRDELDQASQLLIGSDGSDGGFGSGSDAGSDGGFGSGSDAGSDAGSGVIDAGLIDAGPIDAGLSDGGLGAPPIDAGANDARGGFEVGELDRTSFYACAAGGPAGIGLAVPLVVAACAIRRRRRRAGSPITTRGSAAAAR